MGKPAYLSAVGYCGAEWGSAIYAPILLTGLGGHPLKVEIRVRISLGVQNGGVVEW